MAQKSPQKWDLRVGCCSGRDLLLPGVPGFPKASRFWQQRRTGAVWAPTSYDGEVTEDAASAREGFGLISANLGRRLSHVLSGKPRIASAGHVSGVTTPLCPCCPSCPFKDCHPGQKSTTNYSHNLKHSLQAAEFSARTARLGQFREGRDRPGGICAPLKFGLRRGCGRGALAL